VQFKDRVQRKRWKGSDWNVVWLGSKEHVKGKWQGGKWNEMIVASRWKCTNKLERHIQKGTETKQNYVKKPDRILIMWKQD